MEREWDFDTERLLVHETDTWLSWVGGLDEGEGELTKPRVEQLPRLDFSHLPCSLLPACCYSFSFPRQLWASFSATVSHRSLTYQYPLRRPDKMVANPFDQNPNPNVLLDVLSTLHRLEGRFENQDNRLETIEQHIRSGACSPTFDLEQDTNSPAVYRSSTSLGKHDNHGNVRERVWSALWDTKIPRETSTSPGAGSYQEAVSRLKNRFEFIDDDELRAGKIDDDASISSGWRSESVYSYSSSFQVSRRKQLEREIEELVGSPLGVEDPPLDTRWSSESEVASAHGISLGKEVGAVARDDDYVEISVPGGHDVDDDGGGGDEDDEASTTARPRGNHTPSVHLNSLELEKIPIIITGIRYEDTASPDPLPTPPSTPILGMQSLRSVSSTAAATDGSSLVSPSPSPESEDGASHNNSNGNSWTAKFDDVKTSLRHSISTRSMKRPGSPHLHGGGDGGGGVRSFLRHSLSTRSVRVRISAADMFRGSLKDSISSSFSPSPSSSRPSSGSMSVITEMSSAESAIMVGKEKEKELDVDVEENQATLLQSGVRAAKSCLLAVPRMLGWVGRRMVLQQMKCLDGRD